MFDLSIKNWSFEEIGLAIIIGLMAVGWLAFNSYRIVAGVLAGGIIGIINFNWLGHIIKGALSQGGAARYTVKYLFKLFFVIVLSAFLIFFGTVDPVAFIVGFTLMVITVSIREPRLTNRS